MLNSQENTAKSYKKSLDVGGSYITASGIHLYNREDRFAQFYERCVIDKDEHFIVLEVTDNSEFRVEGKYDVQDSVVVLTRQGIGRFVTSNAEYNERMYTKLA